MKNKKMIIELTNPDKIFQQMLQLFEEIYNLKNIEGDESSLLKGHELLCEEINRLSKIHRECLKRENREITLNRDNEKIIYKNLIEC